MIRIYEYDSIRDDDIYARGLSVPDVSGAVARIIADVRARGDAALTDYARKFDRAELTDIEVPEAEMENALRRIDPDLRRVIEKAAQNIREYHKNQVRSGFRTVREDGAVLGWKITPIERVGLYIPGGTASYPSTVLMNAIPAKIAGCREIVMISPPSADGTISPNILAAARLSGVNRVFRSGGAQAIAALAYGTESVPRVDKIVGPGNAYVAEAKRQVFGSVGIEMIAGPSEILVIADEQANPAWVAADLLSQAEHDANSAAVLVTNSASLARSVQAELDERLSLLPRADIARASVENNGRIIVTKSLDSAFEASNRLAPEHLEICLDDPEKYLPLVQNAGSVFLGRYCPEALGDYLAGPNHTLPTSGAARFSSPLSVDDFIKKTQFLLYPPKALSAVAEDVSIFARAEGLEAHARSALIRGEEER